MLNKQTENSMIVPQYDCELTLDERGLITIMSNIPEADYMSISQLSEITNTSEKRIKKILNSLVEKDYVIFLNNVYAVNKIKIKHMQLVH